MWNNDEEGEKPSCHLSVNASTKTGGAALMEKCQIKVEFDTQPRKC